MTSGFYRYLEETGLQYAPNYVYGPYLSYMLLEREKDEYLELGMLPYDGWYWFDSEEEAYAFFDIPIPSDT